MLAVDAPLGSHTSAAVQMLCLARRLADQEGRVLLVAPQSARYDSFESYHENSLRVATVKMPDARDGGHVRRALLEMLLPFKMYLAVRNHVSCNERISFVWYSPSIFLIFFGLLLRWRRPVTILTILRDIFPDWALHLGLISRGPSYYFFKLVACIQLYFSDIVAVQADGDREHLPSWLTNRSTNNVVTLLNWLPPQALTDTQAALEQALGFNLWSKLSEKKVCLYAGTLGVAQDVGKVADIVSACERDESIFFLFVGSGASAEKAFVKEAGRKLKNYVFVDTIHSDLVKPLCELCSVGLVSLDVRHRSHHVPGKFLSYLQAGLPVAATINSGNALGATIREAQLGIVDVENDIDCFSTSLMEMISDDEGLARRGLLCKEYYSTHFSVSAAADLILNEIARFEAS